MLVSAVLGPKLCLPCALPQPLNSDLLCAFQSVLEEINCYEPQLRRLKEKAQQLWEGQAASRSFMHRVSQLSSQYLALSNVTKVTPAMCCVWVCVLVAELGPGSPGGPGAGLRHVSALPSLATPAKHVCCVISTCLSENSKGGFKHPRDFPSLWLHQVFPLILKWFPRALILKTQSINRRQTSEY